MLRHQKTSKSKAETNFFIFNECKYKFEKDVSQDDVTSDLTKQGSTFQGTTHTNRSSSSSTSNKGWTTSKELTLNSKQLTRSGLSQIKVICVAQTADGSETKARDSLQIKLFSKFFFTVSTVLMGHVLYT